MWSNGLEMLATFKVKHHCRNGRFLRRAIAQHKPGAATVAAFFAVGHKHVFLGPHVVFARAAFVIGAREMCRSRLDSFTKRIIDAQVYERVARLAAVAASCFPPMVLFETEVPVRGGQNPPSLDLRQTIDFNGLGVGHPLCVKVGFA